MSRKATEHVYGPYPGKLIGGERSYRVVFVHGTERSTRGFAGAGAEKRAQACVDDAKAKFSGRKVNDAIGEYLRDLEDSGNRPSGIASTGHRLRTFFQVGAGHGGLLADITTARARTLLEATRTRTYEVWIRGGHMGRKKLGKRTVERPRSVTYRAGMLAEAQTFARWCGKQGYLPLDKLQRTPLDGLEVKGRRSKGKVQMRIEEVPAWERVAMLEADRDPRAFAAVLTFYLATRADETLSLRAGDIDRGGAEVRIGDSKTEAGRGRRIEVPAHLRDRLVAMRKGLAADAPLFPGATVDQLLLTTRSLCRMAGVTSVCTQSLRGLHATLAREIGATGPAIARQLGHADDGQTAEAHYTAPGTGHRADQRRVFSVLSGGKS